MAINHIFGTAGNQFQTVSTLPATQNLQATNNKIVSSDSIQTPNTVQNVEPDIPVEEAADKIKDTVKNLAQNLQFSIDEDTGKTVIKVMDTQTQEIIRQIPSQEAISIAKTLDKVQGLLLNDKA